MSTGVAKSAQCVPPLTHRGNVEGERASGCTRRHRVRCSCIRVQRERPFPPFRPHPPSSYSTPCYPSPPEALSFLLLKEEEQGERRVETALVGSGRAIYRSPLGRNGGGTGEERRGSAWAESPRVTPWTPHNPSRAGDTGLSIRSLLARNRDGSTPAEFFSDGDVAARLHGFSGRLFGAHNHAAFGSENRGRLITGGGGPKNRPGFVWGTPPLTVCETTPHVTRGQEP